MKIRIVTMAMMAMMLTAGPLMAMDSEHQEKRRQALQEKSASSSLQAASSTDQQSSREMSHRGEGQHRRVDDEWQQTQEALRYWWN